MDSLPLNAHMYDPTIIIIVFNTNSMHRNVATIKMMIGMTSMSMQEAQQALQATVTPQESNQENDKEESQSNQLEETTS